MKALLAALAALFLSASAAGQAPPEAAMLHQIDQLPRYKNQVASIGMFSSYDRKGANDDGFNGTHSFFRKEAGGLVIAEMKGPGAITRIWTPTPSEDFIEFYIDGERAPRIREPFIDLFNGTKFPFTAPHSYIGAGGFVTYAPIAYAKSMKVVIKAERFNFYQINYVTYARGEAVPSYAPADASALRAELAKVGPSWAAGASPGETVAFSGALPANGRVTLFERAAPGRVTMLRIGPSDAFAGDARDILLQITYDGESAPAISVPAGDFFGHAWGVPAMRSLLHGTDERGNYSRLPMPFDRAVKIELVSERDAPITVEAEITLTAEGRREDEGRLYAHWRRENPTVTGKPYTLLDAKGRGHFVGAILQSQGSNVGWVPEFFEGDDVTTIDGRVVIRGTGSEDFFNGGWYDVPGRWDGRVSLPLSGSLDYERPLARTGGYRFMLSDPYPFRRSILQTIEHGPVGNAIETDYASVVFFYADKRPALEPLPALAARRVIHPRQVVYTPGWNTTVTAFSWRDATLAKADEKVGGEDIRHLQFRATAGTTDVFGPHNIVFEVEMPEAGRYQVLVQGVSGPTQGRVQMFEREVGVGEVIDLYAPARAKTAELPMGERDLAKGANTIMFKLVGKDERSTGLGFDVHRIMFRKVG